MGAWSSYQVLTTPAGWGWEAGDACLKDSLQQWFLCTAHNHLLIYLLHLRPPFHNMNLFPARCCWTLAQVMCLTQTSPLLPTCLGEHFGTHCQVIHKAPDETSFPVLSLSVINGSYSLPRALESGPKPDQIRLDPISQPK